MLTNMDAVKYDFNMSMRKNRLQTFSNWPFNGDGSNCTAEKMADAGFYHCPTDREPDIARCYVCFKELEGWEPQDDPWKEHKSHSPKCAFLALNKTEEEITVQEFLNLESKRHHNMMRKVVEMKKKEFHEMAQHTRNEMGKMV